MNLQLKLLMVCLLLGLQVQAGGWRDRIRAVDLAARYSGPCPSPDQYVAVFRDEFNQDSLDKWFWVPDLLGFQHVPGAVHTDEFVTPDRLKFRADNNGTLRIETTADPILGRGLSWAPDTMTFSDGASNMRMWPFQSGAITSKWPFSQGRYVLRCQVPPGKDMWPAFWLFGACGDEIDIFEFQNTDTDYRHDRRISCSVHSEPNCSPPAEVDTESYNWGENLTTGLHSYSLTWDEFQIVFHVDGQMRRRFFHYYRRVTVIPGVAYSYQGVENCEAIVSGRTYYEDPQFTNALEKITINSAVRKNHNPEQFPKFMDLDYFVLLEPMDCQETKVIHTEAEMEGYDYHSGYGDRTVTAGTIIVQPTTTIAVTGPPPAEFWWPGDLLVLTAADEIRLMPGFEATYDGNFVAQIRPCTSNKTTDELEALPAIEEPELHYVVNGEEVGAEALAKFQVMGEFSLFPNPSQAGVTVVGVAAGDRLVVRDVLGKVVATQECLTDGRTELQLREIPSGIYFVSVVRGGMQVAVLRMVRGK
jgi:hypothetical protein